MGPWAQRQRGSRLPAAAGCEHLRRTFPRTTQPSVPVNTISLASSIAMAVGLAAALPQILRMLRTRSAAGQSAAGWAMGLLANVCMGYVNLRGFDAHLLAASNALSGLLCVAAIALITRFQSTGAAAVAAPAALDAPPTAASALGGSAARPVHHVLADLPTTEFVALRSAIDEVEDLRAKRSGGDEQVLQAA